MSKLILEDLMADDFKLGIFENRHYEIGKGIKTVDFCVIANGEDIKLVDNNCESEDLYEVSLDKASVGVLIAYLTELYKGM